MKLLLPDSLRWDLSAPPEVELVLYAAQGPIPTEHHDADALVAWGHGDDLLPAAARDLRNLRWVQVLSAGTETLESAGFPEHVTLTSGRGLHDGPVAEHALALMLAAARRLHIAHRSQSRRHWNTEIGGLQPDSEDFRQIRGSNVVIWGFGGIGQTLAGYLRCLGANVTGIARSEGHRGGFPVFTATVIETLLPQTDVLVLVLPGSADTKHLLDDRIISMLPRHAWIINVGRGGAVDEDALLAALGEGRLAGAAVDVVQHEPLPAGSSLWAAPNLIITPHAAGGRPRGADTLVETNLTAFLSGGPMTNVISNHLRKDPA